MNARDVLSWCAESGPLRELLDKLERGSRGVDARGVHGASLAVFAAALLDRLGRTLFVVAPDPSEADAIVADLETFAGDARVAEFPAWGLLPYEEESPSADVSARRVSAVSRLHGGPCAVVATVRAVCEPTVRSLDLASAIVKLSVGGRVSRDEFTGRLVSLGYERAALVEELGTFAVRGGIVDVFSPSCDEPVRVELDGDVISSLRTFVPSTQRSTGALREFAVLPRREVLVDARALLDRLARSGLAAKSALDGLERLWDGDPDLPGACWFMREAGIGASVVDHLPEDAIVVSVHPDRCERAARELSEEAEHLRNRALHSGRSVPSVDRVIIPWSEMEDVASGRARVRVHDIAAPPGSVDLGFGPPPVAAPGIAGVRDAIDRLVRDTPRVALYVDGEHRKRRVEEYLDESAESLAFVVAPLSAGFTAPHVGLAVLTDHELLARRHRRRRRRYAEGVALTHYSHLSPGDFVVHEDHGVARFVGLARIRALDAERECLELAYAGTDRVYVPVEEFARVTRYAGSDGAPKVSRLGGTAWVRAKSRAVEAATDLARELALLYAARSTRPGFAHPPDTAWQADLEASFPYEETPDQAAAIEEVKRDLERPTPMDRLVCGDVGYGKTEIAVRAAFKVVQDGRQVAVLVPTTILADQHLDTFRSRLAKFPVRVDVLSRFRAPREQKSVIAGLKEGKVDVVIGTHRLLGKDVSFARLGLLVIDEEHRFGVLHKERIKQLRAEVDCLALTATPIPRTLQMALFGIRDFSSVQTPPKERLPVETEVHVFDGEIIAGAIRREMDRGGQVFFVHNRVESIRAIAGFVQRLVPEARLLIAHGQMRERDLEYVMHDFATGGADVLVCTAIIESGLDLPNVNTIIINRADRFGIAQLYQLRGRVGRSRRNAYAILATPPTRLLTPEARKRLRAIEQHTALGSGYHLSLRDLEIRGAGNIMGREQHGFIAEVGYELYVRMIEEAAAELSGGPATSAPTARVSVDVPAELPPDYVEDAKERIVAYQQLSDARRVDVVDEVERTWRDRFGPPPEEALVLLGVARVRIAASAVGVSEMRINGEWADWTYGAAFVVTRGYVEALRRSTDGELEMSSVVGGFKARLRLGDGPPSRRLTVLAGFLSRVEENREA